MEPHDNRAIPLKGYALCGEPRCGSTYLARLLASTGELGHPREYFAGRDRVRSANSRPELHFADWTQKTATPNGVYGLKIFARQFELVARSKWAVRLPQLRFVHIRRVDVLGQAISWVRASQTLSFESHQAEVREPIYNRRSISSVLTQIEHNQARWACWFARNGIDPLRLTYEEIVDRPAEAVRRIADLMGVSSPLSLADPGMAVQRDSLSEEWKQRYISECRDMTFLDTQPLGIRSKVTHWLSAIP